MRAMRMTLVGKVTRLLILAVIALNTIGLAENCDTSTSHEDGSYFVQAAESRPIISQAHECQAPESHANASHQCVAHCHAGHCHHLGIVSVTSLEIFPSLDSFSFYTQTLQSVVLQEDTRPPSA